MPEEPVAEESIADLVGRTLGEFHLREQIGEGGYAVVYRCEQPALQRDAVVKVLRARRRKNDAARERFLREAQLASRLNHPYAAHVYAFGAEEDGLLWIAMELVQGMSLGAWLDIHGAMPLDQFVPFFECVAQVVQAAHDRGIVHRDLKPSNVMVIERGGRLFPKLLDFGIAKVANEPSLPLPEPLSASVEGTQTARIRVTPVRNTRTATQTEGTGPEHRLTRTEAGIGSRPYMSPEQWKNAAGVGPATDIYSLGIVIYESLTGNRPFNADSTDEYHRLHTTADVPPLGKEFSPELLRVLRRALAKKAEDRHASVRDLASELSATLRAQPREQLRSLAQVWDDRARAPALLLTSKDLMSAPTGKIGELERAFVTASRRYAARRSWIRRALVVSAAALVLGAVWYRGVLKTELAEGQVRAAQQVAEATLTEAELEQGRAALLHNEPEAAWHLYEAYKRDPQQTTAFMLARALEPRLAEQARFTTTAGRMLWAAYSPDGKQIATSDEHGAQIWDAQSHQLLFTLQHGDSVYDAEYSADGARVVTACGDGAVRIWDAKTGALQRELRYDGRNLRYYIVAFSPDGQQVAAIDREGTMAHLWNAVSGAQLVEIVINGGPETPNLAFSADGRWLATTGGDDLHVLDTQTAKPAMVIPGRVHRLAFDPTGPRLLTGSIAGEVALWDVPTGARIRTLRSPGEPIHAIAFSPDGRLVAAAARDGAQQIWRAQSGELQSQLNPHHGRPLWIEFDRTSKLLLAADADSTVVVSDVMVGMPVMVLDGPLSLMRVAHFDPSAQHIVGASYDGTARIWSAAVPYLRWSAPAVSDNCGLLTLAEPDRRFVAVGCKDHLTQVWDTAEGKLIAELPPVSHVEGGFTSAFPAISANGDRAAIARDNSVNVYQLPGGKLLRSIDHTAAVNAVAFSPTGRDIVSGSIDGELIVTRDGGAQLTIPPKSAGIDAVAFAPGDRIIASDAEQRLRIYDAYGDVTATLTLPGRVMSLRVEGDRLVTVPSYESGVTPPMLVDLDSGRLVTPLEGHLGWVISARWVAHNRLLTAGGDGTVRLWDGATGSSIQIYRAGTAQLNDAALTSDGLVMAGGNDGTLRFWDTASGRPLWILPAHKSMLISLHLEGNDIVTRGFTGELSRWHLPSTKGALDACSKQEHCGTVRR